MPIYEYECSDCEFHFERKQNFHEEPVAVCPQCQGKARRVICAVPIIFKGSGFYITDNRKPDTDKPAKGKRETTDAKKSKVKEDESAPTASH